MRSSKALLQHIALFTLLILTAGALIACDAEGTSNGHRKKAWTFEYTADDAIQPAASSTFKKAEPKKDAPATAAPAK